MIAGYMGASGTFNDAIGEFAMKTPIKTSVTIGSSSPGSKRVVSKPSLM
jgi:hypothetical protein